MKKFVAVLLLTMIIAFQFLLADKNNSVIMLLEYSNRR